MLRDIGAEDPAVAAIAAQIVTAAPDVLVLTDFDYDLDGLALAAFLDQLGDRFSYAYASRPNAGIATGLDLDGNGRSGEARDAQGYGRFAGDGGLAVLSRYPIDADAVTDFSDLLWRDLPGAVLPQTATGPFLEPEVQAVLRLSSTVHWVVPVILPDGPPLHLLAWAATPPVFDGPEDMNGLRARDELRLWEVLLDGGFGPPPIDFVLTGNSNLDPLAGDGDRAAMAAFLRRPDLTDAHDGQVNADWGAEGPGALRVSYVLPAATWRVVAAGTQEVSDSDAALVGPHRLVWVEIAR